MRNYLLLMASVFLVTLNLYAFEPASDPQHTHPNAVSFCESLGKRLATSREMAQFAIDHGAKGILEPAQYSGQAGYQEIRRTIANYNAETDFYFNFKGYVSPEPNTNPAWLWTSSYGPHNIDFAYVFNLKTGKFDFDARIMPNGVRCI